MAASIAAQIERIKQDIDNKADKCARQSAQIAAQEITDGQKTVIQNFYGEHGPSWYKRTGGLNNTGILQPPASCGKNHYQAGVYVGSFGMPSPYGHDASLKWRDKISAETVFDLMWNQGVRGLPPGKNVPPGSSMTYSAHGTVGGVAFSGGTGDSAMENALSVWIGVRAPAVVDPIFGACFG